MEDVVSCCGVCVPCCYSSRVSDLHVHSLICILDPLASSRSAVSNEPRKAKKPRKVEPVKVAEKRREKKKKSTSNLMPDRDFLLHCACKNIIAVAEKLAAESSGI